MLHICFSHKHRLFNHTAGVGSIIPIFLFTETKGRETPLHNTMLHKELKMWIIVGSTFRISTGAPYLNLWDKLNLPWLQSCLQMDPNATEISSFWSKPETWKFSVPICDSSIIWTFTIELSVLKASKFCLKESQISHSCYFAQILFNFFSLKEKEISSGTVLWLAGT